MRKNDLIKLMKSKRRKTVYCRQIPANKNGDKKWVGITSDREFSFTPGLFKGSYGYRAKINELENVNYYEIK